MDEVLEDLCEHLSRNARYELVGLLLEKLGSTTKLAAALEITERAIRKWLLRLTHPSNMHLQHMVELAFELDRIAANEIITRDFSNFSASLKSMSCIQIEQTDVPPVTS